MRLDDEVQREQLLLNRFVPQMLVHISDDMNAENERGVSHLQSPSGMSSRLLFAAMNSVRLESLPTPGGTPSKSSLLELMYSFFSLDSLQIAD